MRNVTLFGLLGTMAMGCGGGEDAQPAPKSPETTAVIAPTSTTTVETKKVETTVAKKSFTELRDQMIKALGDAVNTHDPKKASAVMTDDVSFTMVGQPELHGKVEADKVHEAWFAMVTDMKASFAQSWCNEKEQACVLHWAWTGTDSKGLFPGAKPSNKTVGTDILTFVWLNSDGQAKKIVNYTNMLAPLVQAGLAIPGVPANINASLKKMAQPVPTLPASIESFLTSGSETETKNIDTIKAMDAAFDAHKSADVFANAADDLEHWGNDMDKPMKSKAEAKKMVDGMFAAIPDAKAPATNLWAAGDFVVAEETFTGTQKKAWMGMPASNKTATMHTAWVYLLKGGKITKQWAFANPMEGMPAPAGPAAKAADTKAAAPAAKTESKAADKTAAPAKK